MKKIIKDIKGITLISLITTIVMLLILATIGTYSGIEVIKSSKFTKFTTEMKIMQTQVNELYDKYISGDNEIVNLGKTLDTVQTQADMVFNSNASGITDQTGYRYFDKETIQNLNIEGIKEEFFINIENRSVVSYKGFKYEGVTYYTLEQIPSGLYNVEYENKNIGQPTFDVDIEEIEKNKWKISISNIQYDGYIDKWEVKYKLEEENRWNTSKDLSFIVKKDGNYKIKLVNDNIESIEVSKIITVSENEDDSDDDNNSTDSGDNNDLYIEDGLILRYDGIQNTRSGNNPNTAVWEDLSGNNNDGTFINTNNTILYKENGYEFTNNADYIKTINTLDLLSDPDITFEFVYKLYGFQDQNHKAIGLFNLGSKSATNGKSLGHFISPSTNVTAFITVNVSVKADTPQSNLISNICLTKKAGPFSMDNAQIYENGEQTSVTAPSSSVAMNLENTAMEIGRAWQYSNQNRTFNGIIYAVRVYNRVLTDEERFHNYELDKNRFNIP